MIFRHNLKVKAFWAKILIAQDIVLTFENKPYNKFMDKKSEFCKSIFKSTKLCDRQNFPYFHLAHFYHRFAFFMPPLDSLLLLFECTHHVVGLEDVELRMTTILSYREYFTRERNAEIERRGNLFFYLLAYIWQKAISDRKLFSQKMYRHSSIHFFF